MHFWDPQQCTMCTLFNVQYDIALSKISLYQYIALWVYPNVNGSVRNFSQNTSTAPIFFLFNYFRENICVTIWPRFYFLYIFVVRVDRKHQATCFFYIFPSNLQSFGDEIFQNGPRKYLSA